jgi:hypothetical protein
MDQGAGPSQREIKPTRRIDRLGVLSRGAVETMVKRPSKEGLQNLAELHPNQRVVFATSHLSDIDELAAVEALAPYRKVDIASLETNQRDPKQRIPEYLAGPGRFHDVKNTFDTEKDMPYTRFDAENFENMRRAMEKGSDIVISAHKPARKWEQAALPDHRGIGAVYLAQLAQVPVVPVALDIHTEDRVGMASDIPGALKKNTKGRPEATLRIGKPIKLEDISAPDMDDVRALLTGSMRKELREDPERFAHAKETFEKLKQQGEQVMRAIAQLLPREKRGRWGQSPSEPQTAA